MSYTTRSGDTWDGIAKAVYGDELNADTLMLANPEQIEVFKFPAGVVLATPDLGEKRNGFLPPWKFEADNGSTEN